MFSILMQIKLLMISQSGILSKFLLYLDMVTNDTESIFQFTIITTVVVSIVVQVLISFFNKEK